jgi:ABC-type transport system involved in multi-copper enzyme maturation permease subunit
MNEFLIHVRKDYRLITADSLFIVLLLVLVAVAFVMAFSSASAYIQGVWGWQEIVTQHTIEMQQKSALMGYWQNIGNVYMVIFLVLSSMAITAEKDNGMVSYILTLKSSHRRFYLSKFVILLMLTAYATIIALAAYLIVFSIMDMPMLNIGDLMASMVFPVLMIVVFAAVGLMLSTLSSKKGAVIAISVVAFFALTLLFGVSLGLGTSAAYQENHFVTAQNVTEFIPLEYKVLIYANPLVLTYGAQQIMNINADDSVGYYGSPVLFDTVGAFGLGLAMVAFYLLLGMFIFGRERRESTGWRKG